MNTKVLQIFGGQVGCVRIQSQGDAWSRWSWSPAVRYGRNGEVPASYAAMMEEQDAEIASERFQADVGPFVPEP